MINSIKILLLINIIACIALSAATQKNVTSKYSTDIVENNSTHIARVTKDSLVVISGSTYLFTVDAPEDERIGFYKY